MGLNRDEEEHILMYVTDGKQRTDDVDCPSFLLLLLRSCYLTRLYVSSDMLGKNLSDNAKTEDRCIARCRLCCNLQSCLQLPVSTPRASQATWTGVASYCEVFPIGRSQYNPLGIRCPIFASVP